MAYEEKEEELESQLNRGALWAITYGDLMSYLSIFFLLLYTAVTSKSMALQMALQGVQEQFGKEGKLMQELFSKHGVQKIAKLEMTENKIRIVFLAPILFDSGSATMKEAAMPDVKRLAESLNELPNPIAIEGHTDNVPLARGAEFQSNWELSAARAFAILRFLEKSGVPPRRLSAIGYGEFRPVKPNDSPENRTANRRIEINILRKED